MACFELHLLCAYSLAMEHNSLTSDQELALKASQLQLPPQG